jgi:hypothetical protein
MEEWAGFGRRVEAHLVVIDQELAALRETLRAAGISVRRQRIRITRVNGKAEEALAFLRHRTPKPARPSEVAQVLSVSPEYAYDLLAALVAAGSAERVARGQYRAM